MLPVQKTRYVPLPSNETSAPIESMPSNTPPQGIRGELQEALQPMPPVTETPVAPMPSPFKPVSASPGTSYMTRSGRVINPPRKMNI